MQPILDVEESVEQKHFRIRIGVAIGALIFCIATVSGAAMWAQNITNHLSNLDANFADLKVYLEKIPDMKSMEERSLENTRRINRLEEWRWSQHQDQKFLQDSRQ